MIFILVLTQIVTFVICGLGLMYYFKALSTSETSRLQQLNDENTQKSKELAEKILDAEREYKAKMAQCENDVAQLKETARKEIEEYREVIIAKGKAESEHLIAQAINTKKELRIEIESEMAEKSVELAFKIFQKVLNADEQKLVYNGLLEGVLHELNNMEKSNLENIELGGEFKGVIDVRSSHPMNAQQKSKLEEILSAKLGKAIKTKEVVDGRVVSGIVIQIGSIVIDGSLSERFRRAAEGLK